MPSDKPESPGGDPTSKEQSKDLMKGVVAAKIKEARLEKGLGLRELARQVGCSPGFLSMVEHGTKRPSSELMDRLKNALGLDQTLPNQVFWPGETARSAQSDSDEGRALTVPFVIPGGGQTTLPFELAWMLGEFFMSLQMGGYKPEILDPTDEEKEKGGMLRIRVPGKNEDEFEFSIRRSKGSHQK